jgi:hypothetical protein
MQLMTSANHEVMQRAEAFFYVANHVATQNYHKSKGSAFFLVATCTCVAKPQLQTQVHLRKSQCNLCLAQTTIQFNGQKVD